MKKLIIVLFMFCISFTTQAQWYYGSGKAVNLENDIGYQKNAQLIKSGVVLDPQTASHNAGAGSIILKTDGTAYIKKDAGNTTNWKKFIDETTNFLNYIPVASPIVNDGTKLSLGTIDYLDFNTATTPVAFDGRMHFDQDDKTLSIDVDSANGVKLQVGQEEYIRAVNKTGLQINDGQVVYINGAQGNRPTIQLAKADALDQSMIIGVATQNIAINAEGMITTYGVVGNYNTSGFSAGDKLYLSASASGTLTNVAPSSPNKVVRVGVALNATNSGKILVNPKVTLDADASLALNSDLIAPTQKAIKSYVDAGLALKADDISAQMKDFTGFVDPSAVTVSYDSTTRQVSIGGTTTAYWRGKPVTLDSTFPAHANSNGTWFLSYDGGTGTVTWSNTSWTFDKLQIAVVNYQAGYTFATREPHGLMQWNSHKELHETIGTYLSSGGDLSSYVLSSTTAANRRPDISSATINDEDIPTVNASLTSKLYTRFSLSTASSTAGFTTGSSDIVNLSGNQPYYNQFTGGAWQQTLMSNNNYQALWLVAIPVSSDAGSQAYRFIWVQGQSQSPTLATIQGLTPNDISLGTLASQSPEYVFIGKIIIQYTAANWIITSVQKLTGNRFNQTGAPAGTYLSSVTTDTTLTGAGTALDPLKVTLPLTATQSELLANTNMTSGYVPKYNGSGLVDSVMYDSGTSIGIGTTSPNNSVEIVSNSANGFQVTTYGASGQNVLQRANGSVGSPAALLAGNTIGAFSFRGYAGSGFTGSKALIQASAAGDWSTSNNGANIVFSNTASGSTVLTERLRLLHDGKLGLGTNSPVSTFHMFENNSLTSSANGQTIEQAGTGDAVQHWLLSGGQRYTMGIDNSDSDKFKLGTSADLASSNLVTIDTTGNTGIGTTAPSTKLDIASTATGTLQNITMRNTNPSGTADGVAIQSSLYNNASSPNSAGYLGWFKEQLWDSTDATTIDSSFRIYNRKDNVLAEKFRITSDGKVGIGTTTPETTVHVVGDTMATGYQYFGSPSTDGSFRMYVSGGALITEKRISGIWTELSRVDEL